MENIENSATPLKTREIWAQVLKKLRENNEQILLSSISNLQVIFTRESITIIVLNKTIYDLLIKNKYIFDKYTGKKDLIVIKMTKQEKKQLTLKQKLEKIFGDKLVVEV